MEEQSVHLEPDACCMHGLSWRVRFKRGHENLPRVLKALGFKNESEVDYVMTFVRDKSERIVYVPKTQRVQLRLSMHIPIEDRPQRATVFAQWLATKLVDESFQ